MYIEQNYENGEFVSITVREALPTELIDAELFETADTRWLQFWGVAETEEGVTGSFRITASNGEWTYRLVGRRPCDYGGAGHSVFEAALALGEPLILRPVTTSA